MKLFRAFIIFYFVKIRIGYREYEKDFTMYNGWTKKSGPLQL